MLLIDGDIICYRTVFSKEAESVEDCLSIADQYVRNICNKASNDLMDYVVYLTGKNNFRHQVAVTQPYKGNRPAEKPENLEAIRQHLLSNHPSDLSEGEEADDRIAIAATEMLGTAVICSIDKDFDQVPGWHYNFVKDEKYWVSEQEGLFFFYTQVLTGDRADNIPGIKGFGPVKAKKALKDCKDEVEMYRVCVALYGSEDRVIENGRLLWLRRTPGQQWCPPEA